MYITRTVDAGGLGEDRMTHANPDGSSEQEPWIGLVEVKPFADNKVLGEHVGALVNVVALASSLEAFSSLVISTMKEYQFETIEMTHVMPFRLWKQHHDVSPSIDELAQALTTEYPVQFSNFHAYEYAHDG